MIRGDDWVERGEGVMPEDILAAEERCGFTIEEGDVLLVRTGNLHRRNVEGPVNPREAGSPACQAACLPLFHERSIAVLGSDTGNDVMPSQYESMSNPIHQVGIVAMGLWILDNPQSRRTGGGVPGAQSMGIHADYQSSPLVEYYGVACQSNCNLLRISAC